MRKLIPTIVFLIITLTAAYIILINADKIDGQTVEQPAPAIVNHTSGGIIIPETKTITFECTGYCPCYKCCGKHSNDKAYGITASRARASEITVAADTTILPFGTRIIIPEIGERIVQDRGGAIKGYKLDIFFATHKQALDFGRQTLEVEIID